MSQNLSMKPHICVENHFLSTKLYSRSIWNFDGLINFCNNFEKVLKIYRLYQVPWHWVKAWHPEAFLRSSFSMIGVTFRNDFSYWTISSGLGNLSEIYRYSQWGWISNINVLHRKTHGINYSCSNDISDGCWGESDCDRIQVI